ncbi:protein Wnt-5a-like [Sycon ciliatum]|uniref:protein Wnt-5a-like n=1 Tax=Sycon ciliatum TaxID=27933 RepID=UPI0031F6453B
MAILIALALVAVQISTKVQLTSGSSSLSFHSMAAIQIVQSMRALKTLGPEQCEHLPGLSDHQKAWCRQHHVFMQPIAQGTRLGLEECSRQFHYQRWNCPMNNSMAIQNALRLDTAEAAFLQSIQSAGMMQAVARVCSRGNVTEWCGCDDSPQYRAGQRGSSSGATSLSSADRPAQGEPTGAADATAGKFVWGGCGDNVDTGYAYGRQFLGDGQVFSPTTSQPNEVASQLMAQQNHEAGRQAVRASIRRTCKCIGLTGACTSKICWRSLPTIQIVGEILMENYRNARQVKVKAKKNALRLTPLDRDEGVKTRIVATELSYVRQSPDYCRPNTTLSISGTRGRQCQELSTGDDGCELLCCGRGYYAKRTVTTKKCKCRFHWCCRVVCDQCISAEETFHCN